MFSKKTVVIVGLLLAVAINIIALSIVNRQPGKTSGFGRVAIFFISPLQEIITRTIRSSQNVWKHYFGLVSAAEENDRLKAALNEALAEKNRYVEAALANDRFRKMLHFRNSMPSRVISAEVVGRDPSTWFKTVIIDKGRAHGVTEGIPVVVNEGIVGQVAEVADGYAKVLLLIDQNSAVDALVQRTRARGVIKGQSVGQYRFDYVLRKHDVKIGDTIISSGLDGVYAKGLRIGHVSEVVKPNSGIFQKVSVTPFVDFEKLEEVLVILDTGDKQLEETR